MNAQRQLGAVRFETDPDPVALRTEVDSVVHELVEHLDEQFGRAVHSNSGGRAAEFEPPVRVDVPVGVHGRRQDVTQVEPFRFRMLHEFLDTTGLAHRVQDAAQSLGTVPGARGVVRRRALEPFMLQVLE